MRWVDLSRRRKKKLRRKTRHHPRFGGAFSIAAIPNANVRDARIAHLSMRHLMYRSKTRTNVRGHVKILCAFRVCVCVGYEKNEKHEWVRIRSACSGRYEKIENMEWVTKGNASGRTPFVALMVMTIGPSISYPQRIRIRERKRMYPILRGYGFEKERECILS